MGNSFVVADRQKGMHYVCFAQFECRSHKHANVNGTVDRGAENKACADRACSSSSLSPRRFIFLACCYLLSAGRCGGPERLLLKSQSRSIDRNKSVMPIGCGCEDNIKMDLEELWCRGVDWHRIETSRVLL
jgi:hypothetical protein